MTNTLHRYSKPEGLKDDYIVFIMTSKGVNDIGAVEKSQEFLNLAKKYSPVNFAGDDKQGAAFRPEKHLNPFTLYVRGRKENVTIDKVAEEMSPPGRALAVFDNQADLEGFLKELKEADLGISVNVSSFVSDIREMAPRTSVTPHSINYALGFRGNLSRLPDQYILALTTMCGHGLISSNFAAKMVDLVKERRLTPEKAAGYMAKFCRCGAFNVSRAVHILGNAKMSAGI
jgi:hypothetical protein